MNTSFNDRILHIIEANKLNKTKFAERLNISQAYVSQICSGMKIPSDRTIVDICRQFNVNETWLRTGEGEPFNELDRNTQITKFVGEIMTGVASTDQQRFLNALLGATPEELHAIAQFAQRLAAEYDKEKVDG